MPRVLRSKKKSVIALAMSGFSTITIDSHIKVCKSLTTKDALRQDREALRRDSQRAMASARKYLEHA